MGHCHAAAVQSLSADPIMLPVSQRFVVLQYPQFSPCSRQAEHPAPSATLHTACCVHAAAPTPHPPTPHCAPFTGPVVLPIKHWAELAHQPPGVTHTNTHTTGHQSEFDDPRRVRRASRLRCEFVLTIECRGSCSTCTARARVRSTLISSHCVKLRDHEEHQRKRVCETHSWEASLAARAQEREFVSSCAQIAGAVLTRLHSFVAQCPRLHSHSWPRRSVSSA